MHRLVASTPLKKYWSVGITIPNIWEKMFQTTTLYLFALHAGLVVETSALAVYTYQLRHR